MLAAAMGDRLRAAWDAGPDEALFREAVFLYTTESFLCPAVNEALRARDATKTHLAPFLRLLHCALRSFPMAQRHTAAAYRAINLTEAQRAQFAPHPTDTSRNYLSFDGFSSATLAADMGLKLLRQWNRRVLLVLTPADPANLNCCPVRITDMSAFPEEHQVLYPLGQQFEVTACGERTLAELGQWLAAPAPPAGTTADTVYVIEMRAVDVFFEMAEGLYADGGSHGHAAAVGGGPADLRARPPRRGRGLLPPCKAASLRGVVQQRHGQAPAGARDPRGGPRGGAPGGWRILRRHRGRVHLEGLLRHRVGAGAQGPAHQSGRPRRPPRQSWRVVAWC